MWSLCDRGAWTSHHLHYLRPKHQFWPKPMIPDQSTHHWLSTDKHLKILSEGYQLDIKGNYARGTSANPEHYHLNEILPCKRPYLGKRSKNIDHINRGMPWRILWQLLTDVHNCYDILKSAHWCALRNLCPHFSQNCSWKTWNTSQQGATKIALATH